MRVSTDSNIPVELSPADESQDINIKISLCLSGQQIILILPGVSAYASVH